jgi:hypothetical protein
VRSCSALGDDEKCYKIFVGKPEGKGTFGRYRGRRGIILELILKK